MKVKNPRYVFRRLLPGGVVDPEWSYQFRYRGTDGKVVRKTGKVPPHLVTKEEAGKWAVAWRRELVCEASRELAVRYLAQVQRKRTGCSIGEIMDAVLDESEMTRKSAKDQREMVHGLARVLAFAHDLWKVNEGGIKGVKKGSRVPDRERIRALPATVINRETVKGYFKAALGVEKVNWMEVYDRAWSLNSTLGHARGIFQGRTLALKLGHLDLPDVSGFMGLSLRAPVLRPEPVEAPEFAKVVALFDGVKSTNPDLWLLDVVIRRTGMRSLSSAARVHTSWMRKLGDGWWLDVEGKTAYSVPIDEEVAGEFLKRKAAFGGGECPVFLPGGSARDRERLLQEHSRLLGTVLGRELGEAVNHRLRKTVASALYHGMDMQTAQEALGHESAAMTRKHYARRMDVSALMQRELDAWRRVQASGAGWRKSTSNVVAFEAGKAGAA